MLIVPKHVEIKNDLFLEMTEQTEKQLCSVETFKGAIVKFCDAVVRKRANYTTEFFMAHLEEFIPRLYDYLDQSSNYLSELRDMFEKLQRADIKSI